MTDKMSLHWFKPVSCNQVLGNVVVNCCCHFSSVSFSTVKQWCCHLVDKSIIAKIHKLVHKKTRYMKNSDCMHRVYAYFANDEIYGTLSSNTVP